MSTTRKLAVLDLETDPFAPGRVPRPFCSGFYDGTEYGVIWDEEKCIERTVSMLAAKSDPLIIYAHNGGKFDWFYFLDHLSNQSSMRIINGRIVQAYIGAHEIRDSFSIMPFGLAKYNKKEIDIDLLQPGTRDRHRDEIIEYLRVDCVSLYELVVAFWAEFGDILTVGSAAMGQLKRFHTFKSGGPKFDAEFRDSYYYGGRVQVFSPGIVDSPMTVLDVNSMYPFAMANYLHPTGCTIDMSTRIRPNTAFITADGISYGAFPVRNQKGGIDFPWGSGRYHCTIHEWNAAEKTRTFRPSRIVKTYGFNERGCFDTFVNHFYSERQKAQVAGDKIHYLFYKYVLNSCYGKFAQNPHNFHEYVVTKMELMPEPWEMVALCQDKYILWAKPLVNQRYYNICTAASITGAARAILLEGLCDAQNVHYCDTDSIIAGHCGNLAVSDSDLGRWKIEATAKSGVFCGKKLYALFDEPRCKGTCVKKAHKGIPSKAKGLPGITPAEIVQIAQGKKIKVDNAVPHFKMTGAHGFVSRTIRRTV